MLHCNDDVLDRTGLSSSILLGLGCSSHIVESLLIAVVAAAAATAAVAVAAAAVR